MRYINPIDLLNLKTDNLSAIDSLALKKAKKVLLAEIELSDNGTIYHNGVELTKSDCLKAIDDLDNKDKKEFHFFISQNEPLNNFLKHGDLTFFRQYKIESIYKLQEFLNFVSPYFYSQYDKVLSENYKTFKIENVNAILSVRPITTEEQLERCYKTTYNFLRDVNNEIEKISKEIELQNSSFIAEKFITLPGIVTNRVNVSLLNILPAYFQSIRNQLAQTTNRLSTTINNKPYNSYNIAFQIVEVAKSISTDGLASQKITKDYYTVKRNFESRQTTSSVPSTVKPIVEDDVEQVEISNKIETETKPEKENYAYLVFICAFLGVGFFYNPVQKIILGISLLGLLVPLWALYSKNEFSLSYFLKNNTIIIIAASIGFFYHLIAQLYVSYYFLVYLSLLYDATLKEGKNKKNWSIYYYIVGALLITLLYHNFNGSLNQILSQESSYFEPELTDKQYFEKGLSLFNQSKYSDAIDQYNKAINVNPNYADAYLDRGASNANLGKYDSAISDYLKAVQIGLNSSTLYSNLGFSYYQLKDTETAMNYFEKALELDPSNANAYRWRGEIKYDKDDNKGAADDYTKAITYKPNASNYFARGLAYYYLNNYKKAIQDMDKAIELNPNAGQYYFDRGDTKDKINDFAGACKDWKTAKEKGYSVPESKINRCTPQIVYIQNGDLSGCSSIKPSYNRTLDNKLLITVGANASVAVKLIEYATNKSVRYVFINKNTTYSIRNIPEGKYYLKIAYGDDWSIMEGQSNCSGRFGRNTLFEKGEDILDFNIAHSENGYQVPSFSLKLDVIITEDKINSFNTDKINESEFYNN